LKSITKALAALVAVGLSASAANATGTAEDRTTLEAEIATQLASGQTPPITASQLRTVLLDMLASTSAVFADVLVDLTTAGLTVGVPSGGNEGVGTINVSSGYFVNGVPVTGTGTVTSVTCGTALTGGTITGSGTCAIDIATNSNVWSGTASKILDAHVAQTSIAPVALTIATSTFTPAFASGINEEITLVHASCPCTIANPSGTYAGLSGFLTIIQSSTGSDTVTWGGNWKFASGTAPTLSTGANAVDILPYYCRTTSFCAVGFSGNVH
jgi:hypothetical protein